MRRDAKNALARIWQMPREALLRRLTATARILRRAIYLSGRARFSLPGIWHIMMTPSPYSVEFRSSLSRTLVTMAAIFPFSASLVSACRAMHT